jgi:hypothetical protein
VDTLSKHKLAVRPCRDAYMAGMPIPEKTLGSSAASAGGGAS